MRCFETCLSSLVSIGYLLKVEHLAVDSKDVLKGLLA